MGSLFGGGSSGGYKAEGPSKLQLDTSYANTQASIKQQQDFVNQLQAQNGLANQTNVFNQQQQLAGQFQNIANGQGPNPAQAMLNQQTGANVSNQAALMAGQRGASANTGLIARQAGMQGGNLQQQAVGQGATMQAQQSLGALGQLQGQQNMMGNMANQQVGQQQTGLQNLGQQSLGQQQNLYGLKQSTDNINAQMAQQKAAAGNAMMGQLMGAVGTVAGGMIGGPPGAMMGSQVGGMMGGGGGKAGGMNNDPLQGSGGSNADIMYAAEGGQVSTGPRSHYGRMLMAKGGKVPAMVSPGEVYLKPADVKKVAEGKKHPMDGEKIKGEAKVKGAKNSYANDTVKKTLDEGGVVLPRSVTKSKDSERKAIEFVEAILSKHKLKK